MNIALIIAAVLSFAIGAAVSFLNYIITSAIMKKKPELLSVGMVVRQVINVSYLAAVYFISSAMLDSVVCPLVGAVIGLTLSMFLFTYLLVKKNDERNK